MGLHFDILGEVSKPTFSHDTLANSDASPYKVGNINSSVVQKISCGQTFINIVKFCCDLDFELSNPFFSQDSLTHNTIKASLIAKGSAVQNIL